MSRGVSVRAGERAAAATRSETSCPKLRELWQDCRSQVSELSVHRIDPGYGLAIWDRVLIQLWRGPATLAGAQSWFALGKKFASESGGLLCSNLSIVESNSPPPADKVRQALSAAFDGMATCMRHQIVVAEGSVARSALVRGVGLSLSNLSTSSLALKVAVSLDEAALTLAPDLSPDAGGAEGLKAAVADLRARISSYGVP